jgi:hypothetical protein
MVEFHDKTENSQLPKKKICIGFVPLTRQENSFYAAIFTKILILIRIFFQGHDENNDLVMSLDV